VPQTTRLESGLGAVQVMGTTSDYFYLRDSASKQVASGTLNRAVGVRPGEYTALLNNSTHTVFVEDGKLTKCGCGSVQVAGGTDEYYYVLDSAGKQLASATLGKATSLFPGTYTIKLNNTTAPAEIKSGGPTTLQAGLLEVTGATDEYYYVLDSAGTQLASAGLQKRTALFPGTWTVKVNNTTVPIATKPGETVAAQTGALIVRGATGEYYYVLNDAGTQLASAQLDKATALFPGTYRVKLNNSIAPVSAERTTWVQEATRRKNPADGRGLDHRND
jgi:6,7-dimethyl-8-ribityllumazine synthase